MKKHDDALALEIMRQRLKPTLLDLQHTVGVLGSSFYNPSDVMSIVHVSHAMIERACLQLSATLEEAERSINQANANEQVPE